MTIELKTREVRENLWLFNLAGDIEHYDGAVAEVIGEGGVIYYYTIKLPEGWRTRPEAVEQFLAVAEARAFHVAITAALP